MRSKVESEYLTFGKAVHKYAERRSKGFDHAHALMFAMEEYKGEKVPQLIQACSAMPPALVSPLVDETGPFVERKFKIYWYSVTYLGKQYDIYVCGTLDVVGMTSEALRIQDYKTARKYRADEVFADYRTSVQMAFYPWVLWRFGYSILPMLAANMAHECKMFIQICAVFLSWNPVQWRPGPITQAWPHELEAFENQLKHHIETQLIPAHVNPTDNGRINDTCNKCDFRSICYADTITGAEWARAQFEIVPYNPLKW